MCAFFHHNCSVLNLRIFPLRWSHGLCAMKQHWHVMWSHSACSCDQLIQGFWSHAHCTLHSVQSSKHTTYTELSSQISHSLHYTRHTLYYRPHWTQICGQCTLGLVTEHWRTRLEGLLKVIKVKHKSGSWQSADASFHLTTWSKSFKSVDGRTDGSYLRC